LVVNAFSNWVTLCANVFIGFLLTPYIIRHIGKNGYGIWTLIISFVGYFGLLKLGVGSAIMRYIPLYDGHNDSTKVNGAFSTAVTIYSAVAFIILAVSVFASDFITKFFEGDEKFRGLLMLVGVSAAIECPAGVLDAAIRSRERYFAANILELVIAIVRSVALVGVLYYGYGLLGMGWVTVAMAFIGLLFNIFLLMRICPDIRFSAGSVRVSHLWALLSFGIMAMLTSLGFMLRFQTDRIVIGKFMGMEALGIYAIAASLMLYYRNGIGATTRVFAPRFAYLDGKGNRSETVSLFTKSTKAAAVVAGAIAVMLLVVGPTFIRLWVGLGFESIYPVLLILTIAHLFDQSQTTSISLLAGSGKQGMLAIFAIVEGVVSVILSVILVQKYGLIGIGIGIAVPMIVIQAFVRPLYVCRFLRIKILQYYKGCLLKPWAVVIFLFVVFRLTHIEKYLSTWFSFVPFGVALGLLYLLISYQFILNQTEQCAVIKKIGSFWLYLQPYKNKSKSIV
jgi:O-antigen/teichoic acid export membrane protein